jgi:hypothetical protein
VYGSKDKIEERVNLRVMESDKFDKRWRTDAV